MRKIRPAAIIDRSRDRDFMREALELAAKGAALGEVPVPADRLWGAQTQRATANFPISGERFPQVWPA